MLLVVVLVLSLSPPPLAGFIGNTTRRTIKREGRRVTAFGCVSLRGRMIGAMMFLHGY